MWSLSESRRALCMCPAGFDRCFEGLPAVKQNPPFDHSNGGRFFFFLSPPPRHISQTQTGRHDAAEPRFPSFLYEVLRQFLLSAGLARTERPRFRAARPRAPARPGGRANARAGRRREEERESEREWWGGERKKKNCRPLARPASLLARAGFEMAAGAAFRGPARPR